MICAWDLTLDQPSGAAPLGPCRLNWGAIAYFRWECGTPRRDDRHSECRLRSSAPQALRLRGSGPCPRRTGRKEWPMFKHILLPTDGSALSEVAVQSGIRFAKSINAYVTGLHVIPPFHVFAREPEMVSDTKAQFEKDSTAHAQLYLAAISSAAKESCLTCTSATEKADHPYEAIIAA